MKDVMMNIEYAGVKYPFVFNLNVMEEIQEEYGTVGHWGDLVEADGEPNAKAVIFGFRAMINEGIDIENEENGADLEPLTLKQVGRLITRVGLDEAAEKINDAVVKSTESAEKNE